MFESLFIFPESRRERPAFRPRSTEDFQSLYDLFNEIFGIERNAWVGRRPLEENEDFDDSGWDDDIDEGGFRVEKDETRQQPLRKEVERTEVERKEPTHREPPSIIEITCDPKYRDVFEKLFPGMAKPVDEKKTQTPKNPFVFVANRLTFLIQTKFPLVFDTSIINNHEKSITIAVNEDKTIPKLNHIEELGFITSEANKDEDIQKEIAEYLEDTCYGNIYCFPTTMSNRKGGSVAAVKFVVYPRK